MKRPIPQDACHWDLDRKRDWLHKECYQFLCNALQTSTQPFTEHVVELDNAFREGFHCRFPGCPSDFPLHSSRRRYWPACKCTVSEVMGIENNAYLTTMYILFRHEITSHPTLHVDDGGDRDRDKFGYYKCRHENCQFVFTTDSTRKR